MLIGDFLILYSSLVCQVISSLSWFICVRFHYYHIWYISTISRGNKCALQEVLAGPREGYIRLWIFSISKRPDQCNTENIKSDLALFAAKMTVMDFFGCAFLAFGPPLAMFTFTVAAEPIRIIILIASAFFWLISLLLSSVLWYAVVPLQNHLAFGLVFSVLFQEAFRWNIKFTFSLKHNIFYILLSLELFKSWFFFLFLYRYLLYWVLRKAERGLDKVTTTHVADSRHVFAYVCGLGFGFMSGVFALVNVLADAVGPGTMGLRQGTEYFFIISAATTLCFILLHTFWGVVFFSALDRKNWGQVIWVVGSHLFVSCMTLLNVYQAYVATTLSAYVVLIITTALAFKVAGGRPQSIVQCFSRQ